MNAGTLFAMLMALTLDGNAVAGTETKDPPEPSESFLDAASRASPAVWGPGTFLRSRDPSQVGKTDGTFVAPSSPAFTTFGAGMFLVSGADLASTELALSRAGFREANPLQRNRSIRILSHAAAPALMYYLTRKLHDRGRPRLALLARIGFTVGYSYAVMHNLRTAANAP